MKRRRRRRRRSGLTGQKIRFLLLVHTVHTKTKRAEGKLMGAERSKEKKKTKKTKTKEV